jgi:hypothetical protein
MICVRRGTQVTVLRVSLESRRQIVRGRGHFLRQHHRVFGRHAGALRELLEHRMGRIAEHGDATARPILHRLVVAQDPYAPSIDALEHAQNFRPLAPEMFP